MDFLDWISDGVNYIDELFTEAGNGASEALLKIWGGGPEELGGDGPVSLSNEADTLSPPPVETPPPTDSVMTVDSIIKQLTTMDPDTKKQFEAFINNKVAMSGLASGAGAMLKTRAQDKMLEAQKSQQDDQQQFLTDERKRRGSAPTAVAQVRPRGLTEGYLRG